MKTSSLLLGGLALVLLSCQLTAAMVPPFIIRQCVKSTQITVEDLAVFYGTEFRVVAKPVKCYLTCLFETIGFAINGKISEDFILTAKNAEEEKVFRSRMETCDRSDVEGECEQTYEAFKCWMTPKAKTTQNK